MSTAREDVAGTREAGDEAEEPHYDLIELLFFGYRDFVGDADQALAGLGYGRAHHRVLHFVDRNPDLRVSDLLAILKITKQSLARVLRQLVQDGYIAQRPGVEDRREKLLRTTARGHVLARRLAELQSRRVGAALEAVGEDRADVVRGFLLSLVDRADRAAIMERIGLHADDL